MRPSTITPIGSRSPISAAANYKAGREGPIILIGHSLGADAVMEMADYLGKRGVPVALVVPFDGTGFVCGVGECRARAQLDAALFHGARTGLPRLVDQCRSALRSEYRSSQHRQVAAAACARDCRSAGHCRLAPHASRADRRRQDRCAASRTPVLCRRGGQAGERASRQPRQPRLTTKTGDGVATAPAKPVAETGTPVIADGREKTRGRNRQARDRSALGETSRIVAIV